MQINFGGREIALKLVYYGPALSGKTTNLRSLHQLSSEGSRGRLMTLETKDDRTLFFDMLPLTLRGEADKSGNPGMALRIKIFTVPGQVLHASTRRLVLQGSDGVAFIADSQIAETKNNNESFANLKANMKENRLDTEEIPIVIQFNKRDMPKVRTDDDLKRIASRGREPVFPATAINGTGVPETFLGLAAATWDQLDKKMGLAEKHGISRDELLTSLAKQLGVELPKPDRLMGIGK